MKKEDGRTEIGEGGMGRERERKKREKENKDENNYVFLIPEFNIASLHLPARDGPLKLG